ncbi:hypothetical protein ISS07_06005 [Candidatus Woesearchaeota archaeon]|nr:hypothetical protein [Candidatus Woesearchaeota archaeon]
MKANKTVAGITGIVMGLAATSVSAGESIDISELNIPTVAESKYLGKGNSDTIIEIPGNETIQKGYRAPNGQYFNTLNVKNAKDEIKSYGIFLDTDRVPGFEVFAIDSDGDGKLDIATPYGNNIPTPDWVMAYVKE